MAQSGEMKAHDNTYGGFLRMLKVGTAITVVVALLVIFLIAS
ncbi:aa3-type cytochrome c oxidase subunit IV [Sphingomonas sp. MG17]|jgi:hypothetical protein|uniref:Aa3-type cytochrome c oxidase subunit IV n=1 Tax=Sphingomonas tagetis TaxID=2949092 RepID=A0A9X2KNK1_9SPHN|nr:aa3-type cytochrome c oxidase subunit IV [Sphingomonas tagetis]MCP3732940.1 aa3-type cytochrome c oxidase subunit IV [Sphingomonas tagetis]